MRRLGIVAVGLALVVGLVVLMGRGPGPASIDSSAQAQAVPLGYFGTPTPVASTAYIALDCDPTTLTTVDTACSKTGTFPFDFEIAVHLDIGTAPGNQMDYWQTKIYMINTVVQPVGCGGTTGLTENEGVTGAGGYDAKTCASGADGSSNVDAAYDVWAQDAGVADATNIESWIGRITFKCVGAGTTALQLMEGTASPNPLPTYSTRIGDDNTGNYSRAGIIPPTLVTFDTQVTCSESTVGGFAELPPLAGTGGSGMGGATYAVLAGAAAGVLAFAVLATLSVKGWRVR